MRGCCLRFYIHENHRHNGRLAYEWLLEKGAEFGCANGNAFRSIASFRIDSDLHCEDLMDSIMDMTIVVELLLEDYKAEKLVAFVRQSGLSIFLSRTATDFEVISSERNEEFSYR